MRSKIFSANSFKDAERLGVSMQFGACSESEGGDVLASY